MVPVAGFTVWFQNAVGDGNLCAAKIRPEWGKLEWNVPSYMTVCKLQFRLGRHPHRFGQRKP